MEYRVLLYYKFASLEDPEQIAQWQRQLCDDLGLKGRILLGEEGINGTVGGEKEAIEAYKHAMWHTPAFQDVVFKESESRVNPFPKLSIKVRPEIISIHKNRISVNEGGTHLSPADLQALYESGEEFYVFDTRNNYESIEGAFKDSITPDIDNFRELPNILRNYPELKDKKVVTVCTGGIRCEKATVVFKKQGFKEVYQLDGGIVNYINQYPNQYFEGDCYIFDDRMRLTQEEIAAGAISSAPSKGEKHLVTPREQQLRQ